MLVEYFANKAPSRGFGGTYQDSRLSVDVVMDFTILLHPSTRTVKNLLELL
jgi:hypothetical protein